MFSSTSSLSRHEVRSSDLSRGVTPKNAARAGAVSAVHSPKSSVSSALHALRPAAADTKHSRVSSVSKGRVQQCSSRRSGQ